MKIKINVLLLACILLAQGITSNATDCWMLYDAAQQGNTECVRTLIRDGADVNTAIPLLKEAPLHVAAKQGHAAVVELLLEAGAKVDAKALKGQTALHFVGNATVADLLLQAGAEVDATDEYGQTPLHSAAYRHQTATAELLVQADAQINTGSLKGDTALHYAASQGNAAVVKLLLRVGAEVNATTKSGHTPLHSAAYSNQTATAELLVQAGAEIDAITKSENTPLHLADHHEIVKLLAERGSNADARIQERLKFKSRYAQAFEPGQDAYLRAIDTWRKTELEPNLPQDLEQLVLQMVLSDIQITRLHELPPESPVRQRGWRRALGHIKKWVKK